MEILLLIYNEDNQPKSKLANGLKPAKSPTKEEMLTLLKFVKSDVTPKFHGGRTVTIYMALGCKGKDNCGDQLFFQFPPFHILEMGFQVISF